MLILSLIDVVKLNILTTFYHILPQKSFQHAYSDSKNE
jgi:hypothetical protein